MAYADQDVERALQTRAITSTAVEACAALKEHYGLTIPERTLTEWVGKSHRERYERIRAEIAPRLHAQIASEMEDLTGKLVRAQHIAVDRVLEELPTMDGKDAAFAMKNLTGGIATNVDKFLLLRGRPNQITEHGAPSDVYAALKRLGFEMKFTGPEEVEGTAEPVEDAQLAEGDMQAGYETLDCEHGAEHRSECPTCSPEL